MRVRGVSKVKGLAVVLSVLSLLVPYASADESSDGKPSHPSWVTYGDDNSQPADKPGNSGNSASSPAQATGHNAQPAAESSANKAPVKGAVSVTGGSTGAAHSGKPALIPQVPMTAVSSPSKPLTLYGRIEEISSHPGAKLPALKAMVPKYDTSQQALKSGVTTMALTGDAVSTVFPSDFAGQYGGTLKVWTAQFDPILWKIDPKQAEQARGLLRPGLDGQVAFDFSQSGIDVKLNPSQVVFSVPMSQSRMKDQISQMLGSLGQLAGAAGILNNLPYVFALNLGEISQGVGVSGNSFTDQLMKNSVKKLASDVLEQDVVYYGSDTNSTTGKTNYSYTESVLRFTRQSSDQLYVQAAVVSYTRAGAFTEKILMNGTVRRGQQMPLANLARSMQGGRGMVDLGGLLQGGMPSMQGGGGGGGGGGADLGQLMQMLQGAGGGQGGDMSQLNQLMQGAGGGSGGGGGADLGQLMQMLQGAGGGSGGGAANQINQLLQGAGGGSGGGGANQINQMLQNGGLNQLMQGGGLNQMLPRSGGTGVQNY